MKISSLTRLTGLVLTLIVVLMATVIIWSLDRLDSAFRMKDAYHNYNQSLYLQLEKPVANYLLSGDAALLTTIESNISELRELTSASLPTALQEKALAQLEQISTISMKELRAAGKLTQPEELLIQNERELNDAISTAQEYTYKASAEQFTDVRGYQELLNQLNSDTVKLGHLRQDYFSTGKENLLKSIHLHLQMMRSSSEMLYNLPRLGIYAEEAEQDDLAELLGFDTEEEESKEEVGDESLSLIRSQINRYPKELANADRFLQQKNRARANAENEIIQLNNTVAALSETISEHYNTTRITVFILMGICIALIAATGLALNYLLSRLGKILLVITQYIEQLSHGHFSSDIDIRSSITEVQILNNAIARLQTFFNQLLQNIRSETNNLQSLQKQSSSEANHLEGSVQEQLNETENAVVQITQLNSSFQEVAVRASQTHSATSDAAKLARQGYNQIAETGSCINNLNNEITVTSQSLSKLQEDSNAIQNVLSVIQGFAEQTNLLALNAAIEAARAGESGRGFAVVADEVRNLAANTAKSAEEIQTITNSLSNTTESTVTRMKVQQEAAEQTVTLAADAKNAIETIMNSIDEINDMSTLIASSTEEQTSVTEKIMHTVQRTNQLTNNSSTAAETNKAQAKQLAATSDQLINLIGELR